MNRQLREMTMDEVDIFIRLKSMEKNEIEGLYNHLFKDSWVLKAISKHAEARELDIDKKVQILILSISDGVVGICVKYVVELKEWSIKKSQTKISFDDFCLKVYPHGFPVWDS